MRDEPTDQEPRGASPLKRIIGYAALASLIACLVFVWMLLRKPPMPGTLRDPEAAQRFTEKVARLTLAHEQGIPSEIRLTEAEINSQIAEGLKAHPPPAGEGTVKGVTVRLEGEKLVAVLAMNVKGQDVYVTIGGNLNFSNRAVRLVPSEVRIGSVPVPVSWMESKIDMQMELPEGITGVRIENSELVVQAD
jgi:hypothetical protein